MYSSDTGVIQLKNLFSKIVNRMRRTKTPMQKLHRVYLKLLALQLLVTGVFHWAWTIQILYWQGQYFIEMPLDWQIAIVYYAILDLVAGIGIWLNTPWGVVLWIIRILSQFVMHTVLAESFGTSPLELTFYLLIVIVFFILRHYAEYEKKFTLRKGLGLVQ